MHLENENIWISASQNNFIKMQINFYAVKKNISEHETSNFHVKAHLCPFAITVNKNGKIIPPYFMLGFQQECTSAFENHVLVLGGSL